MVSNYVFKTKSQLPGIPRNENYIARFPGFGCIFFPDFCFVFNIILLDFLTLLFKRICLHLL